MYATTLNYSSPNNKMISLLGCGSLGLSSCYGATVNNPLNALANNSGYARLLASPGWAIGLGSYEGVLEIAFEDELPAHTVSYVQIDADESLLDVLLGGGLGDALASVLGVVLLGQQEIEIQAKNASGTVVFSRTSSQGFDDNAYRLVQDDAGRYYLRIKPDQAYQSIRITNRSKSLVGIGSEYRLDVYHAFYYDPEDLCDAIPRFTSFDGEGISLDVLSLNATMSSLGLAIDSDFESTYSEISLGLLGLLGASSEQLFYFDNPVPAGRQVWVSMATTGSLVDLGLFNYVELVAYSQGAEVSSVSISSLLDLDLLGLLESGEFFQFPISSDSHAIDQVGVRISSLISLGAISDVLKISGMYVAPESPESGGESEIQEYVICEGSSMVIQPQIATGQVYNWYLDWEGEVYMGQAETHTLTDDLSPGTYVFYVRTSYETCSFESLPSTYRVVVQPQAELDEIGIQPSGHVMVDEDGYYIYQEDVDQVLLTPNHSSAAPDGTYYWYLDEAQTDPVFDGKVSGGVTYELQSDGTIGMEGLPFSDPADPFLLFVNYSEDGVCPGSTPREIRLNSVLRVLNKTEIGLDVQSVGDQTVRIVWDSGEPLPGGELLIERSGTDLKWSPILIKDAAEFPTGTFLDSSPLTGYSYYRLKLLSEGGDPVAISSVKSVYREADDDQLSVFPSIFEHQLTIRASQESAPLNFSLFINSGTLIKSGSLRDLEGRGEWVIQDLGNLPAGQYILVLEGSSGKQSIHLLK